jgi:hypothetical protein
MRVSHAWIFDALITQDDRDQITADPSVLFPAGGSSIAILANYRRMMGNR